MSSFLYSLKIWLTAVVVGALFFFIMDHPTYASSMTFWSYLIVICLYTLLYSWVSFLIFWVFVDWLRKKQLTRNVQRWILVPIGMLLTVLLFYVVFGNTPPDW